MSVITNVLGVSDGLSGPSSLLNRSDFDMSALVNQISSTVVDANDSFNFLNKVASHLDHYSAMDVSAIQRKVETFSVTTQLVSKTVSTVVKDVDSLVRMQ